LQTAKILPAVADIFGNEKAVALYEMHEMAPDFSGFRRYQIIHVVRGDTICEWRKDMGPADNYKGVSQLRIPSFNEHTVDELKGIANSMRAVKPDWKDWLQLDNYIPG